MNRSLIDIGKMEDRLASLNEQRDRAKQKGQAVLFLAREQGRERLSPDEEKEFRDFMDDMMLTGLLIRALDEAIDEAHRFPAEIL